MLNKQHILEAEKQLLAAMQNSDAETLDELLHDDLLFVLPTGEAITKQTDLETHRSGNLVFEEIVSTVDAVSFIGENAVVTSSSRLKGKAAGQAFEGSFRYLRVWKLVDDQLKVIAGSCIPV